MDEKELAEHYDRTDLSGEIKRASWESEVDADPMVVTSLRLPKSLLDWIRDEAASEHARPTALIRRWLEERRSDRQREQVTLTDLATRVDRLESVTLEVARSTPAAPGTSDDGAGSMSDLLAALQRSVDEARRTSPGRDGREGRPVDDRRRS